MADRVIPGRTSGTINIAPAAAAAGTITLAAIPGKYHYITAIYVGRSATAALVGGASLNISTTNLPGGPAWKVGNAMAVDGQTQTDIQQSYNPPLKSSVAGTATTIVCPAPGAAVLWTANCHYYVDD